MNNLLIFMLVVLFALIPFGFGVVYLLYKKTIVMPVAMMVFISSMFCAIVAFAVSEFGFMSLYWAIPTCLFFLVATNFVFKKLIQRPLKNINENLYAISKGEITNTVEKNILNFNNELGQLGHELMATFDSLKKSTEFANEIAKGNLHAEFTPISDKDELGHSLINMRKSLQKAAQIENERKEEENRNNFIANGVAKFAEILRMQTDNINKLSSLLLSDLIDYVGAVQGALFLLNDTSEKELYYEISGAVAYNREKIINLKFKLGEGLVGRCAYEKLPIHMTDMPDNYINITSGLGSANPQCILLVPAIINDKVEAIIELASFRKFENHEIKLIQKISENIASTFSTTKINETTKRLLEESIQQRENMAAQEEELRQNIEELQATQEEMLHKEELLKKVSAELERKEELIKTQIEKLKI